MAYLELVFIPSGVLKILVFRGALRCLKVVYLISFLIFGRAYKAKLSWVKPTGSWAIFVFEDTSLGDRSLTTLTKFGPLLTTYPIPLEPNLAYIIDISSASYGLTSFCQRD